MRNGGYMSIKTDKRGHPTAAVTLHFFERKHKNEEFSRPFGLRTPLNIRCANHSPEPSGNNAVNITQLRIQTKDQVCYATASTAED